MGQVANNIHWAKTFERRFNRKQLDDQRCVLKAIEQLQSDPEHPGLHRHRVRGVSDYLLWAIRGNRGIRISYVEHEDGGWTLTNCCTHDQVYRKA